MGPANFIDPERAILADRDALARAERGVDTAKHPLALAAYQADVRYLHGLVDRYEKMFSDAHGL